MSDLDAAARPPAASTPIITSEMHSPTSHATSGESPRLQRPSTLRNDTDDLGGYFHAGGHLGDSTMSNLDAAARPPSPYRPIITSEMPSPTSHAAIGALARLQRPSPVCNDTIKYSLIL
jgi:hypothetical protein